jgi:putative PIN family toxin of toxin-antitoxin system
MAIDTNSLAAALAKPRGSAARILRLWRQGRVEFIGSDETLREAELVLGAGWLSRVVPGSVIDNLLGELRQRVVTGEPAKIPNLHLKDRGDRDLVAAAVAGGALYLVTADREVLAQRGYAGVEFVTSAEFLERATTLLSDRSARG